MSEILYILMRNDLPSMNAGKAMAQASHASNQFVRFFGDTEAGKRWRNQTTDGFGTVLVLSANIEEIKLAEKTAQILALPTQVVIDPTYPYRTNKEIASLIPTEKDTIPREVNGDTVTLWRSAITCAFVFGTKEQCQEAVGRLSLHP